MKKLQLEDFAPEPDFPYERDRIYGAGARVSSRGEKEARVGEGAPIRRTLGAANPGFAPFRGAAPGPAGRSGNAAESPEELKSIYCNDLEAST